MAARERRPTCHRLRATRDSRSRNELELHGVGTCAVRILSRNGYFLYEYSTGFRTVCQVGRGDEDAAPWPAGNVANGSMTTDSGN
jgi:hypothetical protein